MNAYDLALLTQPADRAAPNCHGWCFGLPPGIASEHWPLDPANGYPLQHGFTLLLPDDYRCHGPEIVAVSFFASAIDHNDGGPIVKAPAIRGAMGAAGEEPPNDPDLLPFWQSVRTAHPRLYRMHDILGIAYAAILLTRPEFDGPLRQPPRLTANRHREAMLPPRWMTVGSAAAFWGFQGYRRVVQDALGGEPAGNLDDHLALRWTPRAFDPNAGRVPCDPNASEQTDYEQPFYWLNDGARAEDYRERDWVEGHAANHIGGTMRPIQAVPAMSPYYIEFDEELGGYNFGDGNAQFDFRDMTFDWACG